MCTARPSNAHLRGYPNSIQGFPFHTQWYPKAKSKPEFGVGPGTCQTHTLTSTIFCTQEDTFFSRFFFIMRHKKTWNGYFVRSKMSWKITKVTIAGLTLYIHHLLTLVLWIHTWHCIVLSFPLHKLGADFWCYEHSLLMKVQSWAQIWICLWGTIRLNI